MRIYLNSTQSIRCF